MNGTDYSDGLGTQCGFPVAFPFLHPGTGVDFGLGSLEGLSDAVTVAALGVTTPSETSVCVSDGFVSACATVSLLERESWTLESAQIPEATAAAANVNTIETVAISLFTV
jgi:hypothetical protein